MLRLYYIIIKQKNEFNLLYIFYSYLLAKTIVIYIYLLFLLNYVYSYECMIKFYVRLYLVFSTGPVVTAMGVTPANRLIKIVSLKRRRRRPVFVSLSSVTPSPLPLPPPPTTDTTTTAITTNRVRACVFVCVRARVYACTVHTACDRVSRSFERVHVRLF